MSTSVDDPTVAAESIADAPTQPVDEDPAAASRVGGQAPPRRRNDDRSGATLLPWTVAIVLALALVGLSAHVLTGDADPAPPPSPDPSGKSAAASERPAPPTERPPAASVRLTIVTPEVDAEIFEAATMDLRGRTNHGSIQVPRSNEPLQLLLRAPGHVEQTLTAVPDRNKRYVVDLPPEPPPPKKRRPGKRRKKASSPDLTDPFARP